MTELWISDYAAHLDAGMALANQGQHAAAIQKYEAAIAVNPRVSVGYANRALSLSELKHFDDALADLNHAIELQPNLAMAYNNRGAVLRSLGRMEDAAANYIKAIELGGDAMVDAHGNLATYYFENKQFNLADTYYRKAIALQPSYALTHWNYGMHLLLHGELAQGWREYQWRWEVPSYQLRFRRLTQPIWLGQQSIAGKTVLLQCEQGLGDMIQFCRYAEQVAALGARVILEVQPSLVELCRTVKGVDKVIAQNDDVGDYDFYCPMMSLPLALDTQLANIPAPIKYLKADVFKVVEWQQRLGIKTKPRVGIVWSSDPTLAVGPSKTIALELFANLQSEQFELVSLQKNLWYQEESKLSAMGIRHFGDAIKNFVDTAALIECMDLVISVDTSVAHLAGALGRPVWILLHSHADWRWLLNRSDSVWYPSARLYRKPDGGSWQDVIAALKPDLHGFTQSS